MWENANIFYISFLFIWWVNILILKYSRSVISTNYINQRVKFNKIYFRIHICNDITFGIIWKQNSNHMELKTTIQWKHKCFFSSKYFFNCSHELLLVFKKKPFDVLIIIIWSFSHKSFLISCHEHEFILWTNPSDSNLCYHYVLQWHFLLSNNILSSMFNGDSIILPWT
jgi:hypothetical protein